MGKHLLLLPGRFVQHAVKDLRCPVLPVRSDGVHHPGDLQRRGQQLPLPEAEIGILPAGSQLFRLRQVPRRSPIGSGPFLCLSEPQLPGQGPHARRAKLLPQPDEIAIAAFFQCCGKIHLAMGDAARAPEHLPIHHEVPGAVVHKVILPRFQRSGRQHRLEHRPHRIALESPVHQRAVGFVEAVRDRFGVKSGQADAGANLGTGGIQHHNAPAGHGLGGSGFHGTLDLPGDRDPHPQRTAVLPEQLRLLPCPELPLRVHIAPDGVSPAGAGQQRVKRRFQPGRPLSFAVAVTQQVCAERGCRIPPGKGIARDAQRRNIGVHFHQKGRVYVALLIEHRLPCGIGIRVKPGVAVGSGQAECIPAGLQTGQETVLAVVEIPAPRRKRQGDHALPRRPRRITRIGAKPEQAADHDRKPQQKPRVESQHPFPGQRKLPLSVLPLRVVWTERGS